MERIEIIVRPPSDHDGRLLVADAMLQVLDTIRLLDEAQQAIAAPGEAFRWRLESASTNSPFAVVAIAEAVTPGADIDDHVHRVKSEFGSGLRKLVEAREIPWWMGQSGLDLAKSLFGRGANGISVTEIRLAANDAVAIGHAEADGGLAAIAAINPLQLDAELPERVAFGELGGVMVAAGKYRGKAAVQIRSEQYGFIWCQLSPDLVEKFGGEHRMDEIWSGKALLVEGRLIYAKGGKLSRIEVTGIREREAASRFDLDALLDPNFTAGLDPAEYLRQLHEGELA